MSARNVKLAPELPSEEWRNSRSMGKPVGRERSGSGARRPSMHATRKLPLDPEVVEKNESQQWSDKTQAEVYGDYYADRKWSRQWLLPGFGKGNSATIDKWARKYLVKEYQRMAGGKKKEPKAPKVGMPSLSREHSSS